MTDYDIPLSSVYDEGKGTRVLIQDGRVSIVERTGDTPHDLVRIRQTEIPRLIEILVARLTEEGNFGTLDRYEAYKKDESA